MSVQLTTVGSSTVTVSTGPSGMEETGPGGVRVTLTLHDGPLTLQFTRSEAMQFFEELRGVLTDDHE
jgi:hypothetical protein